MKHIFDIATEYLGFTKDYRAGYQIFSCVFPESEVYVLNMLAKAATGLLIVESNLEFMKFPTEVISTAREFGSYKYKDKNGESSGLVGHVGARIGGISIASLCRQRRGFFSNYFPKLEPARAEIRQKYSR